MSKDEFISRLLENHPLSEPSRKSFERELIALSLPAHHIILEAPRMADQIYFLLEGFAIKYSFVKSEKITDSFYRAGDIILSFESFFFETPSREYVELMQNSELLCLSYKSAVKLLTSDPDFQFLFNRVITKCLIKTERRLRDLQQLSIFQVHQKLLSDYPGIEQIVPQENIATWLGITPQSLSRIKRRK